MIYEIRLIILPKIMWNTNGKFWNLVVAAQKIYGQWVQLISRVRDLDDQIGDVVALEQEDLKLNKNPGKITYNVINVRG